MDGTAVESRNNLPAELSSFVGRRHELAAVRTALSEHRLVTLFGPGGVGKTRLAFRAAADLVKTFSDGAWVVELAPVADPELVASSVVAALGLRDATSAPSERLVEHLSRRELLLVLDNCEHVEQAAAELAAKLLESCPGVRLIATSRHELGVPGEHLLSLAPLSVPAGDREATTPDGLLSYDAVRLFVDRATSRWSAFEITEANQAALAELVRRLDGVPLAIELASVRVRTLSVQQILDRLNDRFGLLTRGSTAAVPRQQTLRALIDWSHDLLEPREQDLWSRCAVFQGSFDLGAAAAIAGTPEATAEEIAALLEGLVAKSILVREPDEDSAAPGPRFHMLESIKEYGLSRLDESGELATQLERHRAHYVAQVAEAARDMYGPDQIAWLARLRADHENLRAALEGCVNAPRYTAEGLVMAGNLLHYWVMSGRFSEGRRWCGRLLEALGAGSEGAEGARVARVAGMVVGGRLAVLQGDVDAGRAQLDLALGELQRCGGGATCTTWRGHAVHGLALAAVFWGEPSEALSLLEDAVGLHRHGVDPFGVPLALVQLSTVHASAGDLDRAREYAEECIAMSEAASERWCAALARWNEAWVCWQLGQLPKVRAHAREVLRLKEPFGDRMGMAMSMEMLGWERAASGKHREAAVLLGAVDAAMDSIGGALFGHLAADHDACVRTVTATLGPEEFGEAFATGQRMRFDDAVASALDQKRSRGRGGSRGGARTGSRGQGEEIRLTRRESEIAALVAEGLTNRAIAERLFMSPRTAEGHVARILGKLGFTSRDQLAAWVSDGQRSV